MINKTITFLTLLCAGIFFGQKTPPNAIPEANQNRDTTKIIVCPDYPDHDASFLNGKKDFGEKLKSQISLNGLKVVKGDKNFKSILNFIVERDGTISEIQVNGTNEEFNNAVKLAAKRIKGKWVPAKKDGSLVNSKMQIPIVMNLH